MHEDRVYSFEIAVQTVPKTGIIRWDGSPNWPGWVAGAGPWKSSLGTSGQLRLKPPESGRWEPLYLRLQCARSLQNAVRTVTDPLLTPGFMLLHGESFFVDVCNEAGLPVASISVDQKSSKDLEKHCDFGLVLLVLVSCHADIGPSHALPALLPAEPLFDFRSHKRPRSNLIDQPTSAGGHEGSSMVRSLRSLLVL